MRKSDLYNVSVPELGDEANITVVSDAILSGENSQAGKTEYMDATLNSSTIELKSKVRTAQLKKYYNGLSVQFIAPSNIPVGTSYTIKVDSLAAQPYNNKCQISKGDMVNAIYDTTGFVSSNSPIPSNVVRDNIVINAGKGLTGGGDLTTNRTIDVVSEDDGIIVNPDNIKLNVYNGGDSDSTTRPVSAAFAKQLNVKGLYPRQTLSGTINLDNIIQQGLYDCSAITITSFVGYTGDYYSYGTFQVIVDNENNITQIYFPHLKSGAILMRHKYHSGKWSEWRALVDNNNTWRIQPKEIVSGTNLNSIKANGFYVSKSAQNSITNKPADVTGAFELTVTGLNLDLSGNAYTTQLLKDYRNNNYYIRTNNSSTTIDSWTAWDKLALSSDCPYRVGDIYITTNTTNPSTIWKGTTWQKIENAMLRATSSGQASKVIGGSDTVNLTTSNLPSHTHSLSSHTHYMFSTTTGGRNIIDGLVKDHSPSYRAALRGYTDRDDYLITGNGGTATLGKTSPGDATIGATGGGTAFSVLNRHYSVHVWLRLS